MCVTLKSKNHCFSWIEVLEVAMEFMKENGYIYVYYDYTCRNSKTLF